MPLLIAIVTDLVAITLLAYGLYFRRHRRRDLLLSYCALNIGVVAVTIALGSVEEIAYYFTALALGLLAGLHPAPVWLTPVLSALMLTVILIVDSPNLARDTQHHTITLDGAFRDRGALLRHLEDLLSAEILRAEVTDIDMVRDITLVDVRYRTIDGKKPDANESLLRRGPRRLEDMLR